eukprot:4370169-Amphidinium_carterae.1
MNASCKIVAGAGNRWYGNLLFPVVQSLVWNLSDLCGCTLTCARRQQDPLQLPECLPTIYAATLTRIALAYSNSSSNQLLLQ